MPFFPEDCIKQTPPTSGSFGVYVYPIGGGPPISASLINLRTNFVNITGSMNSLPYIFPLGFVFMSSIVPIKETSGVLKRIIFNKSGSNGSSIELFNSTSLTSSEYKIGSIDTSMANGVFEYDLNFDALSVLYLLNPGDITIIYT